jgi:acyl-CoA thioesterase FadM
MNETLVLRGKVKEIRGRKVIVSMTLSVKEKVCAKGEVVMVQIPEDSLSE